MTRFAASLAILVWLGACSNAQEEDKTQAAPQSVRIEKWPISRLGSAAREQIKLQNDGLTNNTPAEIRCKSKAQGNCVDATVDPNALVEVRRIGPLTIIRASDTICVPQKPDPECLPQTEPGRILWNERMMNQQYAGYAVIEIGKDFIDESRLTGRLRAFAERWNREHGGMRRKRYSKSFSQADRMGALPFPYRDESFDGFDMSFSTKIVAASTEIVTAEIRDDSSGHCGGSGSGGNYERLNLLVDLPRQIGADEFFDDRKPWAANFMTIRSSGYEFDSYRRLVAHPKYWSFKHGNFHFGTQGYQHGRTWNDGICVPWNELERWLTPRGKRIADSFGRPQCRADDDDAPDVFKGYLSAEEALRALAPLPDY